MWIRIYFDDKPLFLCDELDDTIQPYVHHDDAIFIDELDIHAIKTMIHEMQQPQIHAGVYFHNNFEELKTKFFKKFTVVQAAGGLVKNKSQQILMIFRRGKWDLPKGKLDEGETLESCALREVKEETGIQSLVLKGKLLTTYHTYHEGSRYILKESHWYLIEATGKDQLVAQQEEDITSIEWVEKEDIENKLENSFPLIRDVINAKLSRVAN